MRINRRSFLKRSAAGLAGAGTLVAPSSASARVAGANDRVRIGVIGTGRQGRSDLHAHAELPEVDIVALSDVYAPNLAQAVTMAPAARQYADFRALLDDKSIDAVIIGTPITGTR
jgi:predicted homoserine dehydrogenase-like protein